MSETQSAKVISVTLNPSLDRTLTTHFLSLGYHNNATDTTRLDPAGRGINVSRGLHALSVPTHAIILLGRDATGRSYRALLNEETFPITVIPREGRTRSNITIYDTGHNNQTDIHEPSPGLTQADRQHITDTLLELVVPGDTVVFAGGLPEEARSDTYALLTSLVETRGATVAINAGGGEPLKQSIQARPDLTYMTQTQLEGLFNTPVRAVEDVLYWAKTLRAQGVERVLVIMEPSHNALLATASGAWLAEWPEVSGTISGLSEALIAGYLAGQFNGRSFEESLGLAATAAAYTVSQVGNVFGTLDDVRAFADRVLVTPVDVLGEIMDAQSE